MNTDGVLDSRLVIERLNAIYLVPTNHPHPESVRGRLDPVLREQVPALCAQMLARAFTPDDPAVWCIRCLDVDLALDVGVLDDARLTRAWSERLAHGIARTVLRGPDGENVLYFRDRVAYLAQFASDLAQGDASSRWYYRSFDGLRHLPTSAALREALTRERALTLGALDELAITKRLGRVLDGMTADDAQRVFSICIESNGAAVARSEHELIESVLDVWDDAFADTPPARRGPQRAIQLLMALRSRVPRLARDGRIGAAIQHSIGFAALLARVGGNVEFRAHVVAGNSRAAGTRARALGIGEGIEHLVLLQQGGAGDLKFCVRALETLGKPAPAPQSSVNSINTPFGGLFLLLPAMVAVGITGDSTVLLTDPQELTAASIMRYLVGIKCLGRARAGHSLNDPVLASALGLAYPPLAEESRAWGADESVSGTLDRLLLNALFERGRATCRWLRAEIVNSEHLGPVLLLCDLEHDAWLAAETLAGDATEALERALDQVRAASGVASDLLLIGDPRIAAHYTAGVDGPIVSLNPFPGGVQVGLDTHDPSHRDTRPDATLDSGAGELLVVWTNNPTALNDAARAAIARDLKRRRSLPDELDYFALSGLSAQRIANTALDLALTLWARAVIRAFASGLMGLSHSSPEHLYRNILEGAARMRVGRAAVQVDLAPRPLQIILNLAGYDGLTCAIPWLDRPVGLTFEKQ